MQGEESDMTRRRRLLRRISILAVVVFLLFMPEALPNASANVVLMHRGIPSAASVASPDPLVAQTVNVVNGCGTSTATGTINAAATMGTITIVRPAGCRGVGITFNNAAVYLTAANNIASELSLVSNTWTGAIVGTGSTVRVCISVLGAGCSSTTMVITSATVPPLTTSTINLANGNNYGSRTRNTLTTTGTATIVMDLYLDYRNLVTGGYAVVQIDTITLVVTQN
jgi:hypothetical protein